MDMLKRPVAARDLREERMARQNAQDCCGNGTILYKTTSVDSCYYTFAQTHRNTTGRVSPNIIFGLGVIIMCGCRFNNCNKCISVVLDAHGGKVWTCLGMRVYESSLHFSINFAINLKILLKYLNFEKHKC